MCILTTNMFSYIEAFLIMDKKIYFSVLEMT